MKKLKSALLLALAVMLAVSVNIGSLSVLVRADAGFSGKFFVGTMVTRVKEGDTFEVPAAADGISRKVVTPAGERASAKAANENVYTATQLGHYKVTYSEIDGDAEYSYNVFCYEDREYYVRVNEKVDDFIPTYLAKGDSIKVPVFELVYKNSRGEVIVVDNGGAQGVQYSEDIARRVGSGDIIAEMSGSLSLVFWAKTGADAVKKYTKEYTVLVQDNFEYTAMPVLNTLSMTGTANLNALYTLPIATASDVYEKNVFIEVSVIGPDGQGGVAPVREYKPNDYGYADLTTKGGEVKFNNKDVVSFYPVHEGRYIVSYVAHTRGGSSSTHDYDIFCSDKLAPVIRELADDLIPTKWGLTKVSRWDGNEDDPGSTDLTDLSFNLPLPYAVDNVDATDDLKLTINLVSPANVTVASWVGDIKDYRAEGGVTVTSAYNTYFVTDHKDCKLKANADGLMKFSFEYLFFSDENNSGGHANLRDDRQKYGDWTWTYQVRDTKDNGGSGAARRSVVTNLSRTFSDIEPPKVNENNLDIPKYVLINNEKDSFTVPVIPLFPDDDTRLTTEYKMSSAAVVAEGATVKFDGITCDVINEFDVKGGETYNIEKIGDTHYMLIAKDNKDYAFALASLDPKVTFKFWATDDVGNRSETTTIEIDMLYSGSIQQDVKLTESDDAGAAEGVALDLSGGKQKEKMVLGDFAVKNIKYVSYTGVEIFVTDPDGDPVSVSAYIYNRQVAGKDTEDKADDVYTMCVRDITLTPVKEGVHRINIRVYDISGKTIAFGYSFDVAKATGGGGIIETAAKIEKTGLIRTEYELEKAFSVNDLSVENVIVRYVEGSGFGLMNNVFTGFTTTTYRIRDYVIEDYTDWADDKDTLDNSTVRTAYSVELKNNEKPTIEIHDIVPKFIRDTAKPENAEVYVKDQFINLPVITAFTKFENAEVEVEVRFKGEKITARKVYEKPNEERTFKAKETIKDEEGVETEVEYRFTGIFAFPAEREGDYNITVTAKSSSGNATSTHIIRIGDRTPPSFTVSPPKTAFVGSEFVRTAPTITAEGNQSTTVTRIEITLKGPNGANISAVSRSYPKLDDLNKDLESGWNFVDAGKYELTYEITNSNDIKSVQTFQIEVFKKDGRTPTPPVVLTTVLIVIGVLLLAGVIVYVVRFRTVKK
ncbi:MAG: hypothetical protein FWE84_03595 [Firmicutes bacterium]|nr:hypothetical protein [Bacillota bacterium]